MSKISPPPDLPKLRIPPPNRTDFALKVALALCAAFILLFFWFAVRQVQACEDRGGHMIKTGRVAYYQQIGTVMVPVEETVCSK